MFHNEQNIERQILNMEVSRVGTALYEVMTGAVGGLAIHAIVAERRPLKAALLSIITVGLGVLACDAGDIHEDSARHLGTLEGQRVREP